MAQPVLFIEELKPRWLKENMSLSLIERRDICIEDIKYLITLMMIRTRVKPLNLEVIKKEKSLQALVW